MSKINEIIEAVKELTVLELSELVKAFEEEFSFGWSGSYGCCSSCSVAEEEEDEKLNLMWCYEIVPRKSM